MYRVVEYSKPAKHLVGAKNHIIKTLGTFPRLLGAERALYNYGKNIVVGGKIGLRLDDMKYNVQREFVNPTNGMVYVKQLEKNDYGKLGYTSYTLPQYREFINRKATNPFSAVI